MTVPNRWEFPGGEIEKDEDIYSALERDISEELISKIETNHQVFNDHANENDTFIIKVICINCKIIVGSP